MLSNLFIIYYIKVILKLKTILKLNPLTFNFNFANSITIVGSNEFTVK